MGGSGIDHSQTAPMHCVLHALHLYQHYRCNACHGMPLMAPTYVQRVMRAARKGPPHAAAAAAATTTAAMKNTNHSLTR